MLGGSTAVHAARPDRTAVATPSVPAAARPAPALILGTVPPGMQYLYGSGEAAAISVQAWRAIADHVAARVRNRPVDGVVLDEGSTLAAPRFVSCAGKPLAAVFDVDETVLLNAGFEGDDAMHPGRPYDAARWRAYEASGGATVLPVPGAADALAAIRAMGVTVVFNTNRSAGNAAFTEAAIGHAGVGPARHGETLYLSGDDATGARKDARRAAIARRFCVVAMAGDQLGDFSDLFNANASGQPFAGRRAATLGAPVARLWGAGWFVLPNPVYGTALKGGMDEVFPVAGRWTPAP
ncbi:HAD family acid phosphatase [Sphingomonas bacterium]|uniref:HAD family acid phosphatase n=1 Tax=Sphingomonas bacterium TaxID=1895847 RepID=UPI00157602C3